MFEIQFHTCQSR